MTRFECIKAMTDKELGNWLFVLVKNISGQYCRTPYDECTGTCPECWTNWLNEEANPNI